MSLKPAKFYFLSPGIALAVLMLTGCIQGGDTLGGFGYNDDCRFCHMATGQKGVRDFSWIYNNPKEHHPSGVPYPLGPASRSDFNQPLGLSDDGVIFFDDDGYGELDRDDIRLFGTGNDVTVECASCHMEHGDSQGSGKDIAGHYLRLTNENSRLCYTCHRL